MKRSTPIADRSGAPMVKNSSVDTSSQAAAEVKNSLGTGKKERNKDVSRLGFPD